ncbi:hypothetical protein EJB05_36192, partial [Eragrostis curvula]
MLGALMTNLRVKAAYASPRMFAADSAAVTPFLNIYGMAQCTRDLAADDCNRCLAAAFDAIPTYNNQKQVGQIVYWSCSVRFEKYPFYNILSAEAAMSPVALYLRKRIRKPERHGQMASVKGHGADEEMRSSELLLYDLSTLRAATDNFSDENKLGEGGFGPVYKGVLQNGQEIAVKRLSTTSQQGLVEMKNEVVLVAKLQHRNLVAYLAAALKNTRNSSSTNSSAIKAWTKSFMVLQGTRS